MRSALCWWFTSTRRIAQDMARELASLFDDNPRASSLADMAIQRLGAAHPLSSVLKKGVAFHHAALPVDVLEELEEALREGTLRFMTCTSTLTEGVNLPVRTVVLAETQWDEAEAMLSGARLVNAMGRARRAGKESEGWIVLVRAAQERHDDFALMTPAHEELEIRSRLATDEALDALAEFEEVVRRGEDATFAFAAGAISEFLSFVWFLLSSEEDRGVSPDEVDLTGALDSTLAFVQADEPTRARWRLVGETARSSCIGADPQPRRHWAHSGTSIATACRLDDLAAALVQRILEQFEAEGEGFAGTLADSNGALSLLSESGALTTLLSLPENERPWRFRQTRAGQSAEISVNPEELAATRPRMAAARIPSITSCPT